MFKLMSLLRTIHIQPGADTISKYSHIVKCWMFECCKDIIQRLIEPSLRFTSLDLGSLCKQKLLTSLLAHFCISSGAHLWDDEDRLSWTWSEVEKAMSQLWMTEAASCGKLSHIQSSSSLISCPVEVRRKLWGTELGEWDAGSSNPQKTRQRFDSPGRVHVEPPLLLQDFSPPLLWTACTFHLRFCFVERQSQGSSLKKKSICLYIKLIKYWIYLMLTKNNTEDYFFVGSSTATKSQLKAVTYEHCVSWRWRLKRWIRVGVNTAEAHFLLEIIQQWKHSWDWETASGKNSFPLSRAFNRTLVEP